MKKIVLFFNCIFAKIKKKFFKGRKNDISQACVLLQNMDEGNNATDEEKKRDEYTQNYKLTTRWQTI